MWEPYKEEVVWVLFMTKKDKSKQEIQRCEAICKEIEDDCFNMEIMNISNKLHQIFKNIKRRGEGHEFIGISIWNLSVKCGRYTFWPGYRA